MSPSGLPIKLLPAYSDTRDDYALQEAYVGRPMVLDLPSLGVPGRFVSGRIQGAGSTVTLTRLAADVTIPIVLTDAQGAQRTIRVSVLPPDFPSTSGGVTGAAANGNIYTSIFTGFQDNSPSYNLVYARDGTPAYYRRLDHPSFNFQKVTYANGTTRYVFLDAPTGFNADKGAADGDVVLLDENFHELRRGRLLANRNHGPLPAENHDVLILADDDWVLTAYDTRTLDLTAYGGKPNTRVVATVVQEVKGGSVLWEFDSTDYPQFYTASTDGNDYTNTLHPLADYVHFNAIERDPSDGGFLLSFRHLDAIVKITPAAAPSNGPVPIKWILGGKLDQFGILPAQRFYHQHDVRIVSRDGIRLQLSLFNNNNGHYDEHPSSAMVLQLDETARTVSVVGQYFGTAQSTSQGSVQVLGPRHYFISWGSVPRVEEVLDGVPVFSLDFIGLSSVYRARKLP
jgi:hypothetical protein